MDGAVGDTDDAHRTVALVVVLVVVVVDGRVNAWLTRTNHIMFRTNLIGTETRIAKGNNQTRRWRGRIIRVYMRSCECVRVRASVLEERDIVLRVHHK